MSGFLLRQCALAIVLAAVVMSAGPAAGQITLSEDIDSGALNVPASVVDGINITLEPHKHTAARIGGQVSRLGEAIYGDSAVVPVHPLGAEVELQLEP